MKTFNMIAKILTALAAVAGAVYIIATYGEQIVAWCKKTLESLPKCPMCQKDADADIEVEITVEEPAAEEAPAEEAAAQEVSAPEEAPAEEAPAAAENEPVADEADFAE